ncbi:Uma2 family endonuclease [Streptomyces sp. S3(2020)]|uniref:Uma2 family endonuclease n=1 Tax=Streptomyces sp. S3(2020) TaxID=2732044 RepID=UPI0014877758|nr:Uma2 family endonuclease [Streptomyces sp. S3(2020)]NNN38268.1 Uma2 family endonuclease [Streptomyces sp. S3(2020)]
MTLMTERPTISGTEPRSFEALLDDLDVLIVPDGYKAEVIRGSIVLSPWSKGYYTRVMRLVFRQLDAYLPEGYELERAPNLFVFPGDERAYGPDIYAAHERAFDTESNRLDGEALFFVAELTSTSTRDDDLTDKIQVYGRAGVPLYLILDMQEGQATVLWTPSAKGYESRCTRPFGEKLPMPAPLDCELDTDGFQRRPHEQVDD